MLSNLASLLSFLPQQSDAPPPAPSPYGQQPQPSYDLSGIQALMSSFGDTAQGLIDRNLGNPTQPGMQSQDYYSALTSGGTGAQNDRFSAMYAPGRYHDEVAAELASDPVYGGAFPQQGDPSVTQYGQPAPQGVSDLYSQTAQMRMLDHPTGSGGRALGGLAGSQWNGTGQYVGPQSQALTDRLADRADREAFNQRKFTYNPLDYANPLKKLELAYEREIAMEEMRQQQEAMRIKQLMAQAQMDAENNRFQQTFDYRTGRDKIEDQAAAASSQTANDRWLKEFGLRELVADAEVASAGREGQMTEAETIQAYVGDETSLSPDEYRQRVAEGRQAWRASQGGGGGLMDWLGLGGTGLPALPAPQPGAEEKTAVGGLPRTLRTELAALDGNARATRLIAEGYKPDEITAILREFDPNGVGVSAMDPGGSSALWEMLRFHPANPLLLDTILGGGVQQMFGGDMDQAQTDLFGQPVSLIDWMKRKPGAATPATASATPAPSLGWELGSY